MNLTNEQLGRIARAADTAGRPLFTGRIVQMCAAGDVAGAIGQALQTRRTAVELGLPLDGHAVVEVLHDVAAEVEREQRKCRVQFADTKSVLTDAMFDGHEVLDRARTFFVAFGSGWAHRVTISSERDSTCWTWERT